MNGYTHVPSELERERENMFLATELAAKQLRDGTAKAQVVTHYLRMSSPREDIERRMMEAKIALLEGQLAACQNDMATQALIIEALESLREYRGSGEVQYEDI